MPTAEFSSADFQRFARLIESKAGLHFSPAKRDMLAARLGKRLRAVGLDSYKEYFRRLEEGDEMLRMLDQVTTNQTYFWREPEHFVHLGAWIRAQAERRPGLSLRLWCAASSSGEEAWTMAMAALEALDGRGSVKVLASDLSERVLEKAVAGCYEEAKLRALPSGWVERWFTVQGGRRVPGEALRAAVSFARLNLTELPPGPRDLDAIFCRNVMIYFDRPVQAALVAQLQARLRPGGWLYTGMAESLLAIPHGLQNRAPSAYQKPS